MVVWTDGRQHGKGNTNRGSIAKIRIRRCILIGIIGTGYFRIIPGIREIHILCELNSCLKSGSCNHLGSRKNFTTFTLVNGIDGQENIIRAIGTEIRHNIQVVDQCTWIQSIICGCRAFRASIMPNQCLHQF